MIQNRMKVLWAEKELREQRKIDYITASEESGVPKSVLSKYSAQDVKRYDVETLEKLCRYFGCTIQEFLWSINEQR